MKKRRGKKKIKRSHFLSMISNSSSLKHWEENSYQLPILGITSKQTFDLNARLWMLGKGGGKTVGRGGKEVGGTGPSPCDGDSTHHHGEKNSLLRYQKSHWSLTCLVYAHSGIKGGTTGVHIEIHSYSRNLLWFLWKLSAFRVLNTYLISKWKKLHFHRLLDNWLHCTL